MDKKTKAKREALRQQVSALAGELMIVEYAAMQRAKNIEALMQAEYAAARNAVELQKKIKAIEAELWKTITLQEIVEAVRETGVRISINPHDAKRPFRCPVCQGARSVPSTLYNGPATTAINSVACRTCEGLGIVWGWKEESKV